MTKFWGSLADSLKSQVLLLVSFLGPGGKPYEAPSIPNPSPRRRPATFMDSPRASLHVASNFSEVTSVNEAKASQHAATDGVVISQRLVVGQCLARSPAPPWNVYLRMHMCVYSKHVEPSVLAIHLKPRTSKNPKLIEWSSDHSQEVQRFFINMSLLTKLLRSLGH